MLNSPETPNTAGFWEFVRVRHAAYWRKQNGERVRGFETLPYPYSTDRLINSRHFPNVFRELDPGTIYFHRQTWNRPKHETLLASIIYRLINRESTFIEMGGIPKRDDLYPWILELKKLSNRGHTIFTDKHQVVGFARFETACDSIVLRVEGMMDYMLKQPSIRQVFELLRNDVPGMSGFFAWQVCCDLMEAHVLPKEWELDWVYAGPGPIRAFQMMVGQHVSQKQAFEYIRQLYIGQPYYLGSMFWDEMPFKFPDKIDEFTFKNIEHSLCEYSRYIWAHWKK